MGYAVGIKVDNLVGGIGDTGLLHGVGTVAEGVDEA